MMARPSRCAKYQSLISFRNCNKSFTIVKWLNNKRFLCISRCIKKECQQYLITQSVHVICWWLYAEASLLCIDGTIRRWVTGAARWKELRYVEVSIQPRDVRPRLQSRRRWEVPLLWRKVANAKENGIRMNPCRDSPDNYNIFLLVRNTNQLYRIFCSFRTKDYYLLDVITFVILRKRR